MGKVILIIAAVLILIGSVVFGISKCQDKTIINLESQVEYLEDEIIPMEFEITKYSNSKIKLQTVFYDLDGSKVGSKSVKLDGNELNIDFKIRKLSDKGYIFFPYGIYSDLVPLSESIKLFDEYNDDGFPEIYDGILEVTGKNGENPDRRSKKTIKDELSYEFNYAMKDGDGGIAIHDMKNISNFKKNTIYQIVCHPSTGTIDYRVK